jgi:glutaredoxin
MFPAWLFGFSSWWRRRRGFPVQHLHFVLYTRQGCHLCEFAERQLEAARRRHWFILEVVDVDEEPELAERYGTLVPVVTINRKVRFRGAINPVLLDRLLHAEEEKATGSLIRGL